MLCQHVSPYFQTILTYLKPLKLSTLLYHFQVNLQGQILHNAWVLTSQHTNLVYYNRQQNSIIYLNSVAFSP
jgi:hypothetical protein